ncbi:5'-nucleotidase [Nevskia sp.]|uniref:5'-nucleotidase n=1 Tax=Nevskia sp. TaxID=1929292 RepID=UPI0025D0AC54|nr:5'-nucleotidase [Nevskia sp.]
MPYDLSSRLVIGLASSALFELSESDRVFREAGEAVYRQHQLDHRADILKPGVAFPFIKRLLSLNALRPGDPLVEVILLSKNDPDTGLRVMDSIAAHGLAISRAVFLQGRSPHRYIEPLRISLFLSADEADVRDANAAGHAAGQVLQSSFVDAADDDELRIAFDFDGVLADDQSEAVFQRDGLASFHDHERRHAATPVNPGPLAPFLRKLRQIQALEEQQALADRDYLRKLRVSIVTARDAPSHERVITTMRDWGVTVNEAFFLGGIEKRAVLSVLKPHIFFDDQQHHLTPAAADLPCVHIPFGMLNRPR